ncbi:GNAT family N-acetyltransferase [Fastidiosipila sanguinis]|uniref:N-acetyltransferase domain-containing protein n=1 Tax=Fastidiosipila sanguinis TaxID=236753 RepID=A0A2S0KLX5_9FIRM|nr:GNAT family N-acetyltransferase [Fastidiosipila sanguinis]AVM42040.1 hypothetical protein C5Q98_01795 [Fastidiosipila sanguinis]
MELRDLGRNDLPGIFNLLKETWYLDEEIIDPEVNDAKVSLDLDNVLSKSSWAKVVVDEEEVKAVITARVNGESSNLGMLGNNWPEALLTIVKASEKERSDFINYKLDKENKYSKMLEEHNDSDAEIVLLIVDPTFQGHGVGRKLFKECLDYFRRNNVKKFNLKTDSACNYNFYDHMGMTCVAQEAIAEGSDFTFLLYEGEVE